MADTPNLTLPLIDGAQTQKHVTHNEALEILDVLVQLTVLDRNLTTPPGSPNVGDTYIVAATATGDWTGQENNLAYWDGAAWAFIAPKEGWQAYIRDEDVTVKWDGTAWGGGAVPAHTHDAGDVTSGAFADGRIQESNVTQHQGVLSITESQISDLQAYLLDITGESIGGLLDVDLTGLADGDALRYNNANSQFEPVAPGGGAGLEFIASADLSSDATADFTGFDSSKYDAYLFVLQNVVPASDGVSLHLRTSTDGGSSYDSGSTDYNYVLRRENTGGDDEQFLDFEAGEIGLVAASVSSDTVGSAGGEHGVSGNVRMPGPHLAQNTHVEWQLAFDDAGGLLAVARGAGRRGSAADVDAVRFLFSSGNLESGTITMYGLKNA